MRKATGKSHELLRDEIIDKKINNDTRETKKILRMRAKLEKNEQIQDSQKLLLQHLGHVDEAVEDLAEAAQNGDVMRCRELVRAGINTNAPDAAGFLPLHYACLSGFIPVATLLLEHGSDVSSYLTGMSPMEIAAKHGHADMLSLLHRYGADVGDGGAGGSPPIVSACGGGHLSCVERLSSLGADLNAGDLEGLTALHMSTKLKTPKPIIRFLFQKGADKTRISRKLLTPLQLALSVLNVDAIEALGGRKDPSAPATNNNSTANKNNNNSTAKKVRPVGESIAEIRAANTKALGKPGVGAAAAVGTSQTGAGGPGGVGVRDGSVFSAMTLESSNNSLVMD
jgi:ankyrin repeat protein